MKILAVINASAVNELAWTPFSDGPDALARVVELARLFAATAEDGDANILLLAGPGVPERGLNCVRRDAWTMRDVLAEAKAFSENRPGIETILYLQADAPFTDAALARTLLDLHGRYRAEYTFADGYPPGFAPELLAARTLPNLVELAGRHDAPSDRDGLFAVIQKDINSFDIETQLSPLDLRAYRFSPVCDSKRNCMAAERLWRLGARSAEDVIRLLPAHPELLRTVPAFMWVQIVEACPQACSYCPYPLMVGEPGALTGYMPTERFRRLMQEAELLCGDLVVDLSLWGEPSLHPGFDDIVAAVMEKARFTLIVETSGIGWKPGLPEALAARYGKRVQWIVSLDDPAEDGYRSLRGEGKDEAEAFAERMIRRSPGNVHVQAVRMKDNESRLEVFYRGWKKVGEKVIIQKYDSFAGTLPDLTVAELAPLDRLPCRHLARDLAVLVDGSVPPCKHCLSRTSTGGLGYYQILGNVFDEGLKTSWDRMDAWYTRHLSADYPEPCGRCDEYHTFNA